MTAPQSLIDRVEAATGPCRELDAEIWEYLGLAPEYDNSKNNYGCWHYRGEGRYHFADDSSWGKNQHAPLYTSSLDAALTLVPENETLQLTRHGGGWVAEVCCEDETSRMVSHDSAALALCAAALCVRGVA